MYSQGNRLWLGGIAFALLCATAGPVCAQLRNASVSRPSEGPSTRVGLIGGLFADRQVSALGTSRAFDVNQGPHSFNNPFTGSAGRPSQASPLFSNNTFSRPQSRRPDNVGRVGRANSYELAEITGYSDLTNFENPLGGVDSFHIDIRPTAAYFVPPPDSDPFNAFFGLRPYQPPAAPPPSGPTRVLPGEAPVGSTFATLMEQEHERTLDELAARAEQAFRFGTSPLREDQADQLAKAVSLLTSLRDLDRKAYLPSLLLAHAAMERGEPESMLFNIFSLIERFPGVFGTPSTAASFFGDKTLLEAHARRFLRFGDSSSSTPRGYVIQAFAAWTLGDLARMREALNNIDKLQAGQTPDPKVAKFLIAMSNTNLATNKK